MAFPCRECRGKGERYVDHRCPTCGGGQAVVYRRSGNETITMAATPDTPTSQTCPTCYGRGYTERELATCGRCLGSGNEPGT